MHQKESCRNRYSIYGDRSEQTYKETNITPERPFRYKRFCTIKIQIKLGKFAEDKTYLVIFGCFKNDLFNLIKLGWCFCNDDK
jgi:hypothetical protein